MLLNPTCLQVSLTSSLDRECGASLYVVLFAVLLNMCEYRLCLHQTQHTTRHCTLQLVYCFEPNSSSNHMQGLVGRKWEGRGWVGGGGGPPPPSPSTQHMHGLTALGADVHHALPDRLSGQVTIRNTYGVVTPPSLASLSPACRWQFILLMPTLSLLMHTMSLLM